MKQVRAFVIGWHISLAAADSIKAFQAEMERLVALALPHFSKTLPNLLVFPEHTNLPLLFSGPYAEKARSCTSFAHALASLGRSVYSLSESSRAPFETIFSQLAATEKVYIAAAGDFAASDGKMYNQTLLFGPAGELIGATGKVNLVPIEKELGLSPGLLEDVKVFDLPFGRVGVAISLDAFSEEYLRHLAAHGAQIILQNDANNQPWAAKARSSGVWQPEEWQGSILGSVQKKYRPIQYNICPMLVGNFFDLIFDGQSTITATADSPDQDSLLGVGRSRYHGNFLFKGEWSFDERNKSRQELEELGRELLPGGKKENQYLETVGWADLRLE